MRRVSRAFLIAVLTSGAAGAQEPAPPAVEPSPAPPPAPSTPPPDQYYVEPPSPPAESPAQPAPAQPAPAPSPAPAPTPEQRVPGPTIYEPPPPGAAPVFVYEPPPPPEPRHIAPKTAFWVGARIGYFVPFGNAWANGTQVSPFVVVLDGVPWSDYASSGPMFELDVGARITRNYNVFALWERAELGPGNAENDRGGGQTGGDSDFWAVGLRASSDADKVGFLTEIAIGYRRARAIWEDGSQLQFTDSIDARIGLGADIRLNRHFSLSPMLTIGVGGFGDIDDVTPDGRSSSRTDRDDQSDGHAWFTLQMGGHFDIAGSKK